jgi:hypothetical protein
MFDSMLDKQKVRMIRDTFTVEHALTAIENALDKCDQSGIPLVTEIDDIFKGREQWCAELVNTFILNYLLGTSDKPQVCTATGAGDEKEDIRPLMRARFKAHARMECRKKHPKWTRAQIRDHVDTEVTDERIIAAIEQHARQAGSFAVGAISDWWQWLKDNWNWQVFFSILGILLMFI